MKVLLDLINGCSAKGGKKVVLNPCFALGVLERERERERVGVCVWVSLCL